jgi:hypothetical protein
LFIWAARAFHSFPRIMDRYLRRTGRSLEIEAGTAAA